MSQTFFNISRFSSLYSYFQPGGSLNKGFCTNSHPPSGGLQTQLESSGNNMYIIQYIYGPTNLYFIYSLPMVYMNVSSSPCEETMAKICTGRHSFRKYLFDVRRVKFQMWGSSSFGITSKPPFGSSLMTGGRPPLSNQL